MFARADACMCSSASKRLRAERATDGRVAAESPRLVEDDELDALEPSQ